MRLHPTLLGRSALYILVRVRKIMRTALLPLVSRILPRLSLNLFLVLTSRFSGNGGETC